MTSTMDAISARRAFLVTEDPFFGDCFLGGIGERVGDIGVLGGKADHGTCWGMIGRCPKKGPMRSGFGCSTIRKS